MRKKVWEKMVGVKHGKLTLIKVVKKGSKYPGLFRCDCGVEFLTEVYRARVGKVKSCGCSTKELIGKANTKHGHSPDGSFSPEYQSWRAMKERCLNKNNAQYNDYGGRGITLYEPWLKFTGFLADMGKKPTPKHTLDRIDNDKGYFPENCRWITRFAQSQNKRSNNKVVGVRFREDKNTWLARLDYDGKHVLNRSFKSFDDAVRARKEAERKLFSQV